VGAKRRRGSDVTATLRVEDVRHVGRLPLSPHALVQANSSSLPGGADEAWQCGDDDERPELQLSCGEGEADVEVEAEAIPAPELKH